MADVASYSLLFYGGPDGYQTNRAQIQLSDANGQTLAWVRFNYPDMAFEADYEDAGIIRMHLPSEMFGSVLDVLSEPRLNHRPVVESGLLAEESAELLRGFFGARRG